LAKNAAKIGVLILIFGIAIWLRQRFTTDPSTFNRYVAGVNLMQSGHPYEAVSVWEALIHEDPKFPDTYLRLAEYYTQQNNPRRAVTLLGDVTKLRLDDAQQEETCELLAEAYNKVSDTTTALHAAQAVVKLYPNSARAHLALAVADERVFDHDGVIAEINAAERINPGDAGMYLWGARYNHSQGDPDAAEQQARQCTVLAPGSAEGWYVLGWALESRPTPERLQESVTDLQHAAQLDPTGYSTWLELGNALMLTGQNAAGIPCLERARSLAAVSAPTGPANVAKLLQDRMRISRLLVQSYQAVGNMAKAAEARRDSDRFAAQVQAQGHAVGARD
jgi:tetratricopeptide (TPR) repeat protein